MLKHILNSNASVTNTERSTVKQNGRPNGQMPQQQQAHQDAVNAELQSRLRTVAEPEYQNTRVHSPISDFYRNTPATSKTTRSLDNVGEAEPQPAFVNKPRSELVHWSRPRSGGMSGPGEPLHANQRTHSSRGSVLNHSYAGTINSHSFTLNQQHHHHQQQKLNQTDILNLSSAAVSPTFTPIANGTAPKIIANGGLHIAKNSPITPISPADGNNLAKTDSYPDIDRDSNNNNNAPGNDIFSNGVKEMLTSLGLLCLISLLLALLSLIFLLKISPVTAADVKDLLRADQFTIMSPDEYVTVYEVTLALCALSLSLNLCCLLVCSVQFLFAVKLAQSSVNGDRTNKYLQRSALTRICAIAGFFISIPVFLTGVILYTFIQFHSTPAIITSVLIGSGIIFCGCAMVHNVLVWQREKTNAVKALVRRQRLHQQLESSKRLNSSKLDAVGTRNTSATALSTLSTLPPHVGVDMSSVTSTPHELSTLV
ncbi:uncharacterized protein LOC135831815 [Planococcus citri]|uniref:uncharacterized protein LOC135831815 n=1 Tax=Planococcus citri TaxID=170843 RepID=UPI0031F80E7A